MINSIIENTDFYDLNTFGCKVLILLRKIELENKKEIFTGDELFYLDFFCSHPFLIFQGNIEGFDLAIEEQIRSREYTNPNIMLLHHTEHLVIVFDHLVQYGMIDEKWTLTEKGRKIIDSKLNLLYFKDIVFKNYILCFHYILNQLKTASISKRYNLYQLWIKK